MKQLLYSDFRSRTRAFFLFVIFFGLWSQLLGQVAFLPDGLRQHNLTGQNASLFNPVYSFDWNEPNALSVWTRWQWTGINEAPTTILAQYSQMLGYDATVGLGYFENNTGTLQRRGATANYSQALFFEEKFKLLFGVNLFAFTEELSDIRFPSLTVLSADQLSGENNFIIYVTPGVRADIGSFSLALALENALDYDFSRDERRDSGRRFSSIASYDYRLGGTDETPHFIRPMIYFRSDPIYDSQYGINMRYSHRKFWLQSGYNNYFGIAAGAGVRLMERLSIGATMEFGTTQLICDQGSTLEIQASYRFGELKRPAPPEEEDEEELLKLAEAENAAQEKARRAEEDHRRQRLLAQQDSIIQARLKEQKRLDSIARLEKQKFRSDEKYEEVATMQGLQPGYYLITNVFSNQRYYATFMESLRKRGLRPKSFKRSLNGYNYVYLKRFDTLEEIREARDSKFDGKYRGPTWIFRVKE